MVSGVEQTCPPYLCLSPVPSVAFYPTCLKLPDEEASYTVFESQPRSRPSPLLGSQESECLVEEAFRLWNTTLSSLPEVPQPLLELLPHLGALLTRGKVRERERGRRINRWGGCMSLLL